MPVHQLDGIEIAGDRGLGFLIGGIDEPHDEEEGHHGGHEIGIGNLPHAAMMAVMVVMPATANNDDLTLGFGIDAHWTAAFNSSRSGAMRVSSIRSPKEKESSSAPVSENRQPDGRRAA